MGFELGKDPKSDNKADGDIIWVDQFKSFLPEEISKDELASKLKMLIAMVKEDHARFAYKKEVKHYTHIITDIVRFAQKNGYKSIDLERDTVEEASKDFMSKNDNKWDDIVDG